MTTRGQYPDRFDKLVTVSCLKPEQSKERDAEGKPIPNPDFEAEKLLRKISKQVDTQKEEEVKKAREIIEVIKNILIVSQYSDGVPEEVIGFGLSAIQVREFAVQEWIPRVTVIRIPSKKPLILDMINPQIIRGIHSFKYEGEGCLSYPGQYLSTRRFYGVRLGFIDANDLKPRELELYGVEAVCVQHEVDHHDGKLFKDFHKFPIVVNKKIGPNEPCTCGKKDETTGKINKFKKCCGAK